MSETGCWIDGHWGQYGISHLFKIATDNEMPTEDGDSEIVKAYENGDEEITLSTGETVEVHECMVDLADKAEAWLNDNIAEEGYLFGWYDGEFMYWSIESWEEIG